MLQLRRMELSDMDSLMKLKNAEGWNQLPEDWALLINYRKAVNLVALLDNRIVGSVTALNYANKVAWIGMMLVEKDYRGRGIGKALMLEVIHKLSTCGSVKLDATPAGRPLYLKLGFKDEYELYRMSNPAVSKASAPDRAGKAEKIKASDIPEIANFDKQVFGADRIELITRLYENYPELAWVYKFHGRVAGFCLGRKGQHFTQIGPVNASSAALAEMLLESAINQLSGQAAAVDIPADKPRTRQWLESRGFKALRPFERMYLRQNPHPGKRENLYLIAGPELG